MDSWRLSWIIRGAGLLVLLTVVGCQPQLVPIEVTRVVNAGVVEIEEIPVTRVITEEVTRVVTEEVTRIVPEEIIIEVTKVPLGTEIRPIQLLFPPTVSAAVITARIQPLVVALEAATGQSFEVGVADSATTAVSLLCGAPQDTIAVLAAQDAVLAAGQCEAVVGQVAVARDSYTWQLGMAVTRRDSGLRSLEDLAGKRWAVADMTNLASFRYFQAKFAELGIEPGEVVIVPGDSEAMLAVYRGEVDFATGNFTPPILPYDERQWVYGEDDPEIWWRFGRSPERSPIGYVVAGTDPDFGGYQIRDARARVFDTNEAIFDETRIVALSEPVPNDTIVYGAEFPLGLARQITTVLEAFVLSETCNSSLCSTDFYGWVGLETAITADYDAIQYVLDAGK